MLSRTPRVQLTSATRRYITSLRPRPLRSIAQRLVDSLNTYVLQPLPPSRDSYLIYPYFRELILIILIFLPQPFQCKAMESLFRERMHLLKSNSVIKLSFFFSFTIKFAFTSLSSLRAKNQLSFKIIVLLVYIPTILNRVPVVIIRKQGLNIKIVIKSFFLQYLLQVIH